MKNVHVDVAALAGSEVTSTDGKTVQLGMLWRDRPAVLVWLRHFGCVFCRELVQEFGKREEEFDAVGARLAFIGCGSLHFARGFQENYAPGATILTDPELRSYEAIGAVHGILRSLNPMSAAASLRATLHGHRQGRTEGPPGQQGGVVVVGPGDRVAFARVSRVAGDHPNVDDVLAAARVCAAETGAVVARAM